MKPLLLTLTAIAAFAALPTGAKAGDHRSHGRSGGYYNAPAQHYGGQQYRGSCQTDNRAYYSRGYSQPAYREVYVERAPVRYYESECRPRPVQVCRPQPRGGLLSFIFRR